MDITANCPHCQSAFTFDATMAGQQGTCPTCQAQVTLMIPPPAPQPPAPMPPPQPAAQTPTASQQSARTPKAELAKIRAGTCYGAARAVVNIAALFIIVPLIASAVVAMFTAVSMPARPGSFEQAGVFSTGCVCLLFAAIAIAARQACHVIFDIADTLIANRLPPT